MEPLSEGLSVPEGCQLVSRSCRIDVESVRPFLQASDGPRVGWASPDGPTIAGTGVAAALTADGPERFDRIRAAADTLFERVDADGPELVRPRIFGGFAFHEAHESVDPWGGFPGARFLVPATKLTIDGGDAWLTATAADPDADPDTVRERLDNEAVRIERLADESPQSPPGVVDHRRTPSLAEWREQIERAVERIENGELTKVVLASSLSAALAEMADSPSLLDRLSESYPGCYRFLFEPADGAAFVGATPERLVSLCGRSAETAALAGSTGRGDTSEEDGWLADELLGSEKDRHEHEVVVDAIREQLAPLSSSVRAGSIDVRTLATVQHLETPITAELADAEHVLTLVEALHPTPAVGGRPPNAALATIRETEAFERGWYAAPVGWIDAAGDGTFSVAIRSAVVDGDEATLFAGAGIVGDSDPDREWDEVQLKYGPMLDALDR